MVSTVGADAVAAQRLRRTLQAVGTGLLVCLVVSVGIHATVFVGLHLMGTPGGGGEEGQGGGGGDTVEISVAGPALLDEPQPGVPPPAEEPPPPEPEPEPEVAAAPPEPPPQRVHHPDPVQLPEEPEEQEPEETAQETVRETPDEPTDTPERQEPVEVAERANAADPQDPIASGTGAERDSFGRLEGPEGLRELILGSAGLLPGSLAEQSALLPERQQCDDPVVGVWRAHKFNPLHGDWAQFTLKIRRDGNRLHGTILTRLWRGTRFDSSPPPCRIGSHDYTVSMRAQGRVEGQRISFGANSYRVVRAHCPSPFFAYNPDHFSGEIDPEQQEFQSVNNDGGRDVNAPYLFRRTGCDPD